MLLAATSIGFLNPNKQQLLVISDKHLFSNLQYFISYLHYFTITSVDAGQCLDLQLTQTPQQLLLLPLMLQN
ncbi:hypothetical protein EB796_000102 [Bugula neritina]|uniref:Uncharacterized protein n=1 Tax=Bugula neritina TaxID=10212 RepID=A0A7J7KTX3_BUGNE|nr:hypothetical protein EB796_000102 [Bugula neritina]